MVVDTTDQHDEPSKLTTLVGREYSPQASGGNLHRVLLTPADGDVAKKIRPVSFIDSDNPEELWDWLDHTRKTTGANFVAIPHNVNLCMGNMFARARFDGEPIADFNGYNNWDLSSSGLAAVWAKDNTREEIFAACRRREVSGTTGPRISLRFFGGYEFEQSDLQARDLAKRHSSSTSNA